MPRSAPARSAEPDAADTDPPRPRGFFGWIGGLDLPRRSGWIGGVCAGVAARLGVDPLLVRGVAVVIAVLGGPVALLYALAWFLLPDENGTIHARELGRGHLTRALPGIAGVFLLSFLPLAQGFWFAGSFYWADAGLGGAVLRVLWTAVLVAAAVVAVVWLARRAAATDIPTTPATTDDQPDTVPTLPAETAATNLAEPGEPPAPPADASTEELAAWKHSQDEWQRQRAAWAADQRRSEQELRQAEARERSRLAFEAARERARVRRLTRPRARAGIVALVLGVALLVAAFSAWAAYSSAATRGTEWIVGAAILTLTLGVGIVAVALGRRRSGALSFFGILSLVLLVLAAVLPPDRQLLPLGAQWGISARSDGRYAQLAGTTSLYLPDAEWAAGSAPVVDLWQYAGHVRIDLEKGATLRLEYLTDARDGRVFVEERFAEGGRYAFYEVTDGALDLVVGDGDPDLVLRLWGGGQTTVTVVVSGSTDDPIALDPEPTTRDAWGEPAPTPVPTPTLTPNEGVNP